MQNWLFVPYSCGRKHHQCSIAPTYKGMTRLSWPEWLVTYRFARHPAQHEPGLRYSNWVRRDQRAITEPNHHHDDNGDGDDTMTVTRVNITMARLALGGSRNSGSLVGRRTPILTQSRLPQVPQLDYGRVRTRDVRGEWLFTFPFPPITMQSISIPSHPHFQFCDCSHFHPISMDLFPFPSSGQKYHELTSNLCEENQVC